jgi:elongation factor Tu
MARRQFLDGAIKVTDLSEVTSLRITPVTAGTSGRAFRVLALPGKEIVYWSFFRAKANRFARKQSEELQVPVDFESNLYGQSLKFGYSYKPIEYVVGGVVLIGMAALLQRGMEGSSALAALFGVLGLFQLIQACKARAAFNNL